MKSDFAKAVALVLKHEGGYVNDPHDPGGETNFGISKRSYPNVDIRGLTQEAASAIYRRDYWDSLRCEELPHALALQVFDHGVNAGLSSAARLLQRTLGVKDDGVVGPVTIEKARESGPVAAKGYARRRIEFYSTLANFERYKSSWIDRTLDTLLDAVASG